MKRLRLFFSGLAVIVLVGSSLAFRPFSSGSVFCTSSCTSGTQIAFKVDASGTNTAPCLTGSPHVLKGDTDCVATDAGTHFKATTDQ